jgi:hypothetical protein
LTAVEPDQLSRELLQAAQGGDQLDRQRAGLASLDPLEIRGDRARIAFWLNLYNALVLAELGRRKPTGSLLRNRDLFAAEVVQVGGQGYSLDAIEHGVLRRNARPPYRIRRLFGARDPRRGAAPSLVDPRVHFALNCGAVSCPPIRAYDAAGLDPDLESTTTSYIRAETRVDRARGKLELPYLMRLYKADFDDPVEFAASRLEPGDAAWVREQRPTTSFGRFDWTLVAPEAR